MEYSRKVAYNTRYMIYQSFLLTLKNRKKNQNCKSVDGCGVLNTINRTIIHNYLLFSTVFEISFGCIDCIRSLCSPYFSPVTSCELHFISFNPKVLNSQNRSRETLNVSRFVNRSCVQNYYFECLGFLASLSSHSRPL